MTVTMPPAETLFSLPATSTPIVTCTRPLDKVYVLTINYPPDNRLRTDLCQSLLLALDILELRYKPGVLITTSAISKFYSNGLDLDHVTSTPGFWEDSLYALWRRLLTYNMPTVALVNGHAFGGALMLAMFHDYRIMNPHKGYLCLNELQLGVPLQPPMASIFRQKVPSHHTYRTLVLEAKRFRPLEALKEGLVDGLGEMTDCLAFVDEMQLRKKGGGVYGELKREMWRETVALLDAGVAGPEEKLRLQTERRVVHWEKEKDGGKAKL